MTFLADILARKAIEVEQRRSERSERELSLMLAGAPPARSLYDRLSGADGPTQIIAEVKRSSPSAGAIRRDVDAASLARQYEAAGAAAISVLTDGPGFGGSLADLAAVRAAVSIPVLRKDFVVDRYQLVEARAAGADAALLIVAALSPEKLRALLDDCRSLGLDALVECHDEQEIETAVLWGAELIGINSRDLKTFHVDLAVTERLLPLVPASARAVAESGIRSPADATRLRRAGGRNLLVGEALVRAESPSALLQALRDAS